jgi:hypothetical protein
LLWRNIPRDYLSTAYETQKIITGKSMFATFIIHIYLVNEEYKFAIPVNAK